MAAPRNNQLKTTPGRSRLWQRLKAAVRQPLPLLPSTGPGFKTSHFMDLTARLAAMTEAGLPLTGSLRLLAAEIPSPRLKQHIEKAAEKVESGLSLSESFRSGAPGLPSILISMVEAGESSGKLDTALQRLSLHFEKKHALEQKVKSATAYPKFIAAVLILVVIFLFAYVVPGFESIFQGMAIELPLLTRAILFLSFTVAEHGLLIAAAVPVCFLALQVVLRSKKGLFLREKVKLALPYYRDLYRKNIIAVFCRTLGTMLGSGIDVLTSLELSGKVTDSSVFAARIEQSRAEIIQGYTITEALLRTGFFPPMVIGLVQTGEQTGSLEKMLERTASFYEQDVEHTLNRLGSILEPLFILLMALIVGTVVISIMLPMFQVIAYY